MLANESLPNRAPPPRTLPLVYLAIGHGSLIAALFVPALAPASIDTFFFHARMFFVVHRMNFTNQKDELVSTVDWRLVKRMGADEL